MDSRLLVLPAVVAICAVAAPATACSVPVFRYALQRWDPAPYEAVVFHHGALDPATTAALRAFDGGDHPARPNVEVVAVDVDAPIERADLKELYATLHDQPLPRLVLRYPFEARLSRPAWSGAVRAEELAALADSPARQDIAKHLVGGDSAVWIVLGAGEAGAGAERALRTHLDAIAPTLALPEQPAPGDVTDGPGVDPEGPPLRIGFSVIRVDPADAAERGLVELLRRSEPEGKDDDAPMAFAVFGRGRALPALRAADLTADNVREICTFLTGACSCQVKEMNPGTDLLLATDWSAMYQQRSETVVADPAPTAPAPPAPADPTPGATTAATEVPVTAIAPAVPVAAALPIAPAATTPGTGPHELAPSAPSSFTVGPATPAAEPVATSVARPRSRAAALIGAVAVVAAIILAGSFVIRRRT